MNILKLPIWIIIILIIAIIVFIAIITFFLKNRRIVRPKDNNAEVWEVNLNDLLPGTLIRAIKNHKIPIPILIKDRQNKPIPGVSIIMILSNNLELKYITDSNGIFTVELSSALLKENPIIKISKEGFKAGDFFYEVGGKTVKFSDESEGFDLINFTSLNVLEKNGTKIYYNEEKSTKALNLAELLGEVNHKIEQVLGISGFKPLSVILTESKQISTIGDKIDALPVNINNKEDIYWIYTHEMTEYNLIVTKELYFKNRYLRWVGDGLAEYTSLKIMEQTDKELKTIMLNSRLKDIEEDKKQSFDLLKWEASTGPVEGYAYSLAFWINIEEKYGNDIIQELVNKFLNTSDYSTENITDMLIRLIEADNKQIFTISKEDAKRILLNRKME